MSENSGQRFCGNCGAEIRSGISFCVSCGKPVNRGAASSGPDDPVPPPPPSRSLADTLKETFQGLTERFSNARSASGGASLGGLPNKAIHWFKDLPSVPKLVIVGLALLLLLTILSPVVRVVAIVVFVVSAIVLAVRAIQRKPLRGWIIAVIGSVVLIPVFGGISGAIYGSGTNGNRSTYGYSENVAEPEYSIDDRQEVSTPEGYSFNLLNVTSDLVDQQSLQGIAQEIQPQTTQNDAVTIIVYDSNEVYYRPGVGPRNVSSGQVFRGTAYLIQIANTINGESVAGMDAEVGLCLIKKGDTFVPTREPLHAIASFEC